MAPIKTHTMLTFKARLATEIPVCKEGGVYLTVRDQDKSEVVNIARNLHGLGYQLYATLGTADIIRSSGTPVMTVYRIRESKHPDALDLMRQGKVNFIINVPTVSGGARMEYDEAISSRNEHSICNYYLRGKDGSRGYEGNEK